MSGGRPCSRPDAGLAARRTHTRHGRVCRVAGPTSPAFVAVLVERAGRRRRAGSAADAALAALTPAAAAAVRPRMRPRAVRPRVRRPPSCSLPTGAPSPAAAIAAFDTLASLAALAPPAAALAATPRGRGLVALRPIPAGAEIIAVDRACALIVADGPAHAASRDAASDFASLHGPPPPLLASYTASTEDNWFARLLALFLHAIALGDRDRGSLFRLYAATLPAPASVASLMAFDAADRALLPPDLASLAARERATINGLHARIFDASTGSLKALRLSPSPAATLTAAALVNSRCFAGASAAGGAVSVVCPLVDMANHDAADPAAAAGALRGGTAFGLTAVRAIREGEEVTISYTGSSASSPPPPGVGKDSATLLKDYGFLVPGNELDTVPLALPRGVAVRAGALAAAAAAAALAAQSPVAAGRAAAAARTLTPLAASRPAGGGLAAVAEAAARAAADAAAGAERARAAGDSPRAAAATAAWAERGAVAAAVVDLARRAVALG